jgi:hypothetical protein
VSGQTPAAPPRRAAQRFFASVFSKKDGVAAFEPAKGQIRWWPPDQKSTRAEEFFALED